MFFCSCKFRSRWIPIFFLCESLIISMESCRRTTVTRRFVPLQYLPGSCYASLLKPEQKCESRVFYIQCPRKPPLSGNTREVECAWEACVAWCHLLHSLSKQKTKTSLTKKVSQKVYQNMQQVARRVNRRKYLFLVCKKCLCICKWKRRLCCLGALEGTPKQ